MASFNVLKRCHSSTKPTFSYTLPYYSLLVVFVTVVFSLLILEEESISPSNSANFRKDVLHLVPLIVDPKCLIGIPNHSKCIEPLVTFGSSKRFFEYQHLWPAFKVINMTIDEIQNKVQFHLFNETRIVDRFDTQTAMISIPSENRVRKYVAYIPNNIPKFVSQWEENQAPIIYS